MQCGICGSTNFTSHAILWEKLIQDWQLSGEEVDYVNRQQGETCNHCGSNLRSIALANGLRAYFGTSALLLEFLASSAAKSVSILEINEAGTLTRFLKHFGGYAFGTYPQVDMHAIPYRSESFDLVVHSDTLEHVENPVHALGECRRVLKPGGALCFTVPVVVGRMSRDRGGLAKSYHGSPGTSANDWAVQTEFGADAWTYAMRAGFTDVTIHTAGYPAATAIVARNGWTSWHQG